MDEFTRRGVMRRGKELRKKGDNENEMYKVLRVSEIREERGGI